MAYRKSTLRTMSPTARKVARLIGEQESIARRLKNLIPDLQRLDLESRALKTATETGVHLPEDDWERIFLFLEAVIDRQGIAVEPAPADRPSLEKLHAVLGRRR